LTNYCPHNLNSKHDSLCLFYWKFKIPSLTTLIMVNEWLILVITVFTVFRLLADFVWLYTYEFWLSLCKIARSSVILSREIVLVSRDCTWSFHHWRDLIDQILYTVPRKPELLHQLRICHVIHGIVSVSENPFSSHSASTE
jgi:hypothetical protein